MQFILVYALWLPFRHIAIPVINHLPSGVVNNAIVAIFKEQAVIMTVTILLPSKNAHLIT